MDYAVNNGIVGDLGGIQTHDLQNRNLIFYSAELRGRYNGRKVTKKTSKLRILPNFFMFLRIYQTIYTVKEAYTVF